MELREKANIFWDDTQQLAVYPFSGTGIYILAGGTIFIGTLQIMTGLPSYFFYVGIMITGIVGVFLSTYLSSYFISVMRASVRGDTNPPDWPEFTHMGMNILWPLYVVLFPGIVAFSPALIYLLCCFFFKCPTFILIMLIGVGALYHPMSLIASVMTSAPMNSVNLMGVVDSILEVREGYFTTELMLVCFVTAGVIAHIAISVVFGTLTGPIIAGFALRFVHLYLLMVYARALGLFYRQYQSELVW